MKKIILLVTFIMQGISMMSQDPVAGLKIGQTVPPITFQEMINYPSPKLRLDSLKGKLIILDFWTRWCGVCIMEFPKLQELQEAYKDRLVIIAVGDDHFKKGTIPAFLKKARTDKMEIKLPVAVLNKGRDEQILQYFPYTELPHEVWIDEEGKILAITDHLSVTASNIEKAMNGSALNVAEKKVQHTLTANDRFLLNDPSIQKAFPIYGSAFSPYNDTLTQHAGLEITQEDGVVRMYGVNMPVALWYSCAYQQVDRSIVGLDFFKRLTLQTSGAAGQEKIKSLLALKIDSSEFRNMSYSSAFCYELKLPADRYSLQEAWRYLLDDIDRIVGVKSEVVVQKTNCWALCRKPGTTIPVTNFPDRVKDQTTANFENYELPNVTTTTLVNALNSSYFDIAGLVIDETGYNGTLDIKFPFKQLTFEKISKALATRNLELKPVERSVKMLVLTPR